MPDDLEPRGDRLRNVLPMPASHVPDAGSESVLPPLDVRGYALTVMMILASVLALQRARPLLVPILIGILISYALDPIVRRFEQWHVPHATAATLVFFGT